MSPPSFSTPFPVNQPDVCLSSYGLGCSLGIPQQNAVEPCPWSVGRNLRGSLLLRRFPRMDALSTGRPWILTVSSHFTSRATALRAALKVEPARAVYDELEAYQTQVLDSQRHHRHRMMNTLGGSTR